MCNYLLNQFTLLSKLSQEEKFQNQKVSLVISIKHWRKSNTSLTQIYKKVEEEGSLPTI